MVVIAIHPNGLISEFNKDYPHIAVKEGDVFASANSKKDWTAMLAEIQNLNQTAVALRVERSIGR